MTILDAELKAYKPDEVSDATTNGGRMTATQIVDAVLQNVFGHVFKAERTAGSTKYRKLFWKVANDADETLYNPEYYMHGPTAGDDYVCFWPGSQRDHQSDAAAYAGQIYGAGLLSTDVSAGTNPTIVVDVEHTSLTGIFADTLDIIITDKTTPDAGTGTTEQLTINGAPSVSGTEVTLTTSGTLANSYTVAAGTKVCSVYAPGTDLTCTVDNWAETSTSGTYDESTYPIVCDNIGTIEQTWTLTFSDASNFTVSGDTVGAVGAGTISGDYAPTNSDWSKPYFTLDKDGWGGTWANGETIVFQTHPAAEPIWFKRVVPAACSSLANNKIISVNNGESA